MAIWEPILKSADCLKKLEKPILTKDDIPYDAALIFNAGVEKINGKYVMVFRNDYGTDSDKCKVKDLEDGHHSAYDHIYSAADKRSRDDQTDHPPQIKYCKYTLSCHV